MVKVVRSERAEDVELGWLNPSRRLFAVARKLSPLGAKVVDEYLLDMDAKAVGKRCGISTRRVNKVLEDPYVVEALGIARRRRSERTEVTEDKVVQELAKIGFSNMGDYLRDTSDGDPYIDLTRLNEDQLAAIKRVEVSDVLEGRGKDQRTVRKVKFELYDKLGALRSLGEHLGMFTQRHEVRLSIEQKIGNMTREERLGHMLKLLLPMREYLSDLDGEEEVGGFRIGVEVGEDGSSEVEAEARAARGQGVSGLVCDGRKDRSDEDG